MIYKIDKVTIVLRMERQVLAFFIITFIATLGMAGLTFFAWHYRPVKRALSLSLLFFSMFLWMGAILAGLIARTEAVSYFWSIIRMIGVFTAPVFWLMLGIQYSGNTKGLRPVHIMLISIIPLISLSLMCTNTLHHLFLSGIVYEQHGPFLVDVEWKLGPWFPVHIAYSYSLVLVGDFFFIRHAYRLVSKFLGQAVTLFLGATIPLIVNIIYVFHLIPGLIVNYDPLGFVFSGFLFSAGLFQYRFMDILPVARRFLVDNLHDGLIVIDTQDRIIDMNPSACRIFNLSEKVVIGKDVKRQVPELLLESHSLDTGCYEIAIADSIYELRSSPLIEKTDTIGHLLIIRNVTQQKEMEAQLRQLAGTDPLTGILNRRRFFELAGAEITRAFRYRHKVAVLMIDCDYFKVINDNFGHQIGDRVLCDLADCCLETVRKTDILGRYGGEEFIIISPETTEQDAVWLAERLRRKIAAMEMDYSENSFRITVSIGVSTLDGADSESMTTLNKIVDQADKALYHAKAEGRNRSIVYGKNNSSIDWMLLENEKNV